MRRRIVKSRHIAAVCVVLIFFSALVGDLVKLQIIDGDSYAQAVSSVSTRTATITAARGEIVDTNGNKLVYNEQSYSIVFNASYFPSEQEKRNEIIISLIRLFEDNGLEWIMFPLFMIRRGLFSLKKTATIL